MKPDKHFVTAAVVLLATACLIVLTWVGTARKIRAQRADTITRVTATLSNQALTVAEQLDRQILAIDQTLRALVDGWEANPRAFDLEAARIRSVVLTGLSRDVVMTDETGVIRQSSVTEAIGQSAAGLDYFRALAQAPDAGDGLYIGPAAIDGIMRQWHMNMARAMHYPDGSFAGVIDTDYRIAAITSVFAQTNLGPNGFAALAGLEDGKLRGAVSASTVDPDTAIGDTPMFAAIQTGDSDSGIWIGPSASDAIRRIHAFRRLPGRKLAVVVAMDEEQALRPADEYRRQAWTMAAVISGLLALLALALVQIIRMIRRRNIAAADYRANLAAANAQFEVAQALAAAKAEQLDTTLSGMTDGVSILDAHLCLVEWNARFAEIAGVPADILRVGLPIEEVLRAQIRTGQFGAVRDPEAEVERRVARMRQVRPGVIQRPRPDGRTLELRRNPLPDGGFVTIYADVTERKRTEDALTKAEAARDHANREKLSFAAMVRHIIEKRLIPLLDVIQTRDSNVEAGLPQPVADLAGQSSRALKDVLSEIEIWTMMEAGTLPIRPCPFELRPLLEGCIREFGANGTIRPGLSVASNTPALVLTDPARLSQLLLAMLASAVRPGQAVAVWITAEPGLNSNEGIRLSVRDDGPETDPVARAAAFLPHGHPGRSDDAYPATMEPSICHGLITLMGGAIGCDTVGYRDGHGENILWVSLPPTAIAVRMDARQGSDTRDPGFGSGDFPAGGMDAIGELPRRKPPRTRILLMEPGAGDPPASTALLRRQGHHVDTASTAAAAIQAMKTAPYDLVLMTAATGKGDLETAETIRQLSEPACSTPLIALTPWSSIDDEANAVAAGGMDGVLGQPFSNDELADVLQRFVWAVPPEFHPGAVVTVPEQAFPAALSAERIGELRSNLPDAIFYNLITECLVDMDHRLPALRRALVARAPGAVAAHAHAMLGMAAGYGMVGLESRLRLVMNACRDGDISTLDATIVTDIESDFEAAAEGLRHILGRAPA